MRQNMYGWLAGPLVLLFFNTSCTSIGPPMLPRDRVDYVNAIGTWWEASVRPSSRYPADLIMSIALDSLNGIRNESRREMGHPADPRFSRLAAVIQVPELEDSERKVTPGLVEGHGELEPNPPLLNIQSGNDVPTDSSIAVQYNSRGFWIADTDIRSKSVFAGVMLLFNISNIGVKGLGPIVAIPATAG